MLDRLRKGLHLLLRGREYVIEGRLTGGEIQIKDVATNEVSKIAERELVNALFEGYLELLGERKSLTVAEEREATGVIRELSLLTDKARAQTKRRYSYVSRIKAQGLTKLTSETLDTLIREVSLELGDKTPPSAITLYRWYRRYLASGEDIRVLSPAFKRRGNRLRKLSGRDPQKSEAVAKIIDTVINEKYLSKHRPTVESVCDAINARIIAENKFRDPGAQLSFPHRSTVYDIISRLDPYEVTKARYGVRIADHKHGAVKLGPRPTRPLERIEIDHTKLDLLVVDEVMRLPVGRPWMTTAIDKYSRMIVGLYISFNPPGYLSVMSCLLHAIRPKTYVKERFPNIQNTWDTYGIPEMIVVDNGPEFYSRHFEDACLQLGIGVLYAPPKMGQFKGSMERWFRTQNQQLLHGQPGTTFSNIIDKADYDPKRNAVISYSALEEMAHTFIIDVYQKRMHRGLNDIPSRVWKQAVEEYPPFLPPKNTELEALLGCVEHRAISAKGIELHSIFYNDERLAGLRRTLKPGEKVTVKYDPANLGHIYVADIKKGEYVPVPAVNHVYAEGLTLWQHTVIRRYVRHTMKREIDMVALCLAKERIQQIVEEEWLATKKTTTRQKIARLKNYGQQSPGNANSTDTGNIKLVSPKRSVPLLPPAISQDKTTDSGNASSRKPTAGKAKRASRDKRRESPRRERTTDEADLDMTGWDADFNLPK